MTLDDYIAALPTDFWFEPNIDLWVHPRSSGGWRIGANAFVTHYGRFVIFYPKPAGTQVLPDEPLGVMETWKTAFGIQSPLACTILQGNAEVARNVSLARDDPYGTGWLFEVDPGNLSLPHGSLLSHGQYVTWLAERGEAQFASLMPQPLAPYDPLVGM